MNIPVLPFSFFFFLLVFVFGCHIQKLSFKKSLYTTSYAHKHACQEQLNLEEIQKKKKQKNLLEKHIKMVCNPGKRKPFI
jgi:hypothetical protein